jgi:hypothetical protein
MEAIAYAYRLRLVPIGSSAFLQAKVQTSASLKPRGFYTLGTYKSGDVYLQICHVIDKAVHPPIKTYQGSHKQSKYKE